MTNRIALVIFGLLSVGDIAALARDGRRAPAVLGRCPRRCPRRRLALTTS